MLRVLYATDLSEHSQKIVNVLIRYKNILKEVVIVKVINVNKFLNPFINLLELVEREKALAEEKILGIMDILEDYDVKCEIFYIPVGDPAKEIVRVAECERVDVVMLGHRGRSLKNVLLGSVAEEVARISRIPVFVVKDGMDVFRRILYVHYPLESDIPKILYNLCKVSERIYITHIVEPLLSPESTSQIFKDNYKKAKDRLNDIKSKLEKFGVDSEVILRVGYPCNEILRSERNCKVTCIFLKTKDFTKVADGVLRHSKSSVLIAKEG